VSAREPDQVGVGLEDVPAVAVDLGEDPVGEEVLVTGELQGLVGGGLGVVPAAAGVEDFGAGGVQVGAFGLVLEGGVQGGEGLVVLALGLPGAAGADGGGDPVAGVLGEFGVLFAGLAVVAAEQALPGFLEGRAVGVGEGGGAEGDQAGTEVSHRSVLARAQA